MKKIIALLLIGMLLFGLVACGGEEFQINRVGLVNNEKTKEPKSDHQFGNARLEVEEVSLFNIKEPKNGITADSVLLITIEASANSNGAEIAPEKWKLKLNNNEYHPLKRPEVQDLSWILLLENHPEEVVLVYLLPKTKSISTLELFMPDGSSGEKGKDHTIKIEL